MIKCKLIHPLAKVPTKATKGSAGYDLYTVEDVIFNCRSPYDTNYKLVNTGVCLDLQSLPYTFALLVARSSLYGKYSVRMPSVGIIDNDYQGEILVPLIAECDVVIPKGTAIAQLIFQRSASYNFIEVDEFDTETERGTNGFGSTGLWPLC